MSQIRMPLLRASGVILFLVLLSSAEGDHWKTSVARYLGRARDGLLNCKYIIEQKRNETWDELFRSYGTSGLAPHVHQHGSQLDTATTHDRLNYYHKLLLSYSMGLLDIQLDLRCCDIGGRNCSQLLWHVDYKHFLGHVENVSDQLESARVKITHRLDDSFDQSEIKKFVDSDVEPCRNILRKEIEYFLIVYHAIEGIDYILEEFDRYNF